MKQNPTPLHTPPEPLQWYAIRAMQDVQAEKSLSSLCDEVFYPKEALTRPGRRPRLRPLMPHVMFIRTTERNALHLEKTSRTPSGRSVPFWIYRYPSDSRIQVIPEHHIRLMRLLGSTDENRCEIYNKTTFRSNDLVRVTGGIFSGHCGHVVRVRKNLHVVVSIEGICMVMLPFIHPDLLEKI